MIVIVIGMHRSGTSAMAGLLHTNGISMGREENEEFYPPPMRENPKGFFENVRFRRINDKILRRYGYRVKSFSPSIPMVYSMNGSGISHIMEDLISEYNNEFESWGWKDPRTCLTALTWLRVLKEMNLLPKVRVILMKRRADLISQSMRRRGNKEKFFEHFEQLSLRYYDRAYYYLHYFEFNPKVIELSFEDDLIDNTERTCERLSSFLRYPITNCSFIEPEISKSK